MLSGVIRAALEAFFNAFGEALNDYLGRTRAEKAQRDLGAAEAQRDHANATIDALEASLKAAVDGPSSVDDAVVKLRKGEA